MIVLNFCIQEKVREMPFVQAIRGDQFDQSKVAFSVSAKVTVDAISSVTDPLPFHLLQHADS